MFKAHIDIVAPDLKYEGRALFAVVALLTEKRMVTLHPFAGILC